MFHWVPLCALPQIALWIPNRKKGVGEIGMNLLLIPSLLAVVALVGFLVVQAMFRFAA